MNSNELFTLKSIELNTPIYNYPSVINDNFKFVMDKVSMFYTNSNANFPEKESGNALIAPINNKYVKSNTGKFNNVITDNLTVSSSFNVDGVSFDKIITEQRLDSGSFLIDSSTGKVSIKRDEATLYSCPIEADIKGNLKIGKGVKIYDNDTCVDNIGIGDKNTLLSIGYQNSSDYNGSSYNIAIGAQSLQKLIGGSGNIVLGATSMVDLTTGSGNIVLGSNLCNGISSSQDMLYIGNSGVGTFIKGNMKSGEFLLNNPNSSLKYVNDILLSSINLENIIIGRNNTLKLNYLSGSDNILIGNDISDNITGGMKNIFIGTNSGYRYFDNINYNIAIGVVDTEEGIDEPLLNGNMKSKLLEVNTTSLFINGDIRVSPNFKSSGSGTAIGLDSNNHIIKLFFYYFINFI